MTISEFEDLRTPKAAETIQPEIAPAKAEVTVPSVPPPGMMPAAPTVPGPVNTLTAMASALTTRAMLLASPDDPKIHNLFQHEKDITNGIFLSRIFTQALVLKMQYNIKNKVNSAALPLDFKFSLDKQLMQVQYAMNMPFLDWK